MSRGKTRHKGGGGTPATVELTAAAVPFTEHEYAHDPREQSYGTEAAQALGLDPGEVFKTLLVRLEGGGHDTDLGVVVVPVDVHVDLKAAGAAFGAKRAAMADPAVAARTTGYVVGGISPFGQRRRLPTVLDESALAREVIYVSGGRRGFDIGVAPQDLVRVLGAQVAPVSR
ncbi:Cys-tRNA(Pro) deacylase [Piscicoccus intestinalis]|uniref:Cys-tRNA(Pro) deacylase n=1 Tax=Piscicoccus intestinalis TaxID=746033 RepID=UPI0008395843|nr:Cys-tRNA(Pro) deacylase [Piscicoccus intestinalis]